MTDILLVIVLTISLMLTFSLVFISVDKMLKILDFKKDHTRDDEED